MKNIIDFQTENPKTDPLVKHYSMPVKFASTTVTTIMICIFFLFAIPQMLYAQCQPPNPGGATLSCGPGNATLTAVTLTSNVTHRWYTSPSGGYPISGVVVVNTGGYTCVTTYTTYFSNTTTYYVSTYNPSTYCESSRTPITATVNQAGTGFTKGIG